MGSPSPRLSAGSAGSSSGSASFPRSSAATSRARQIRRTGEQGGGLALAGLILGYVGTALFIVLIAVFVVIAHKIGHALPASPGVPLPAAPGN